jgi:phosphoribosylanthranilate isomerase
LQATELPYGFRMRTRVKICGITRAEDAVHAVAAGADAIGLVFYEPSPRYVTPAQAREIAARVAPFVSIVGLFVNAEPASVQATLEQVPLSLLQFHGDEDNADCRRHGMPFIKSVAMREDTDLEAVARRYPDAAGLLLDAWQPRTHGGGGVAFDWRHIRGHVQVPLILAGGLSVANVAEAIRQVDPYAVDVSSGVEREKGIKSAQKITAFMKGVSSCGTDTSNRG